MKVYALKLHGIVYYDNIQNWIPLERILFFYVNLMLTT